MRRPAKRRESLRSREDVDAHQLAVLERQHRIELALAAPIDPVLGDRRSRLPDGAGRQARRASDAAAMPAVYESRGSAASASCSSFAHESRNVTVRLKTGAPGFESARSATK